MKRNLLLLTIVGLLAITFILPVYANSPIKITFDENEIKTDVAPIIKNGRTLVPLRVISEQFGAGVNWDGKNNTVEITTSNDKHRDQRITQLENALAAKSGIEAVETWAEGMETRNGALQYAVMSSELKEELHDELAAGGWTTGTSSPRIENYEITKMDDTDSKKAKYKVVFTYTDSTGNTSLMNSYITAAKHGDYWYVSDIEKEPNKNEDSENNDDFIKNIDFKHGFYRPEIENLPHEIKDWINYSKEIPLVQEKEYNGYRFVLITAGTKPTGGYDIEVEEVVEQSDKLEIRVKSTEPTEDQAVTQALTYPYDLIIVEDNELPLNFVNVDDPDAYFMKLIGAEAIDKPITAESEWIKVFSPAPKDKIEDKINLTGIASVFEGTVSYELLTENNKAVHSGFTTAAMGDWAYFEEEIDVPSDIDAEQLTLQLYSKSMKDGSKMFVVEIPLIKA